MKVTSRKTIVFPKLKWGINKGETKDLPEDKEAQEIILKSTVISKVEKSKPTVGGKENNNKTLNTNQ